MLTEGSSVLYWGGLDKNLGPVCRNWQKTAHRRDFKMEYNAANNLVDLERLLVPTVTQNWDGRNL